MKIKTVQLKKFKRFTNLTIKDVPSTSKLVVLVGPNGSGKSSLFDAFSFWSYYLKQSSYYDFQYHIKADESFKSDDPNNYNNILQNIKIDLHDNEISPSSDPIAKKAFYFRSAYRNEADFATQSVSQTTDTLQDDKRPQKMILPDVRVSDNYQRIVVETIAEIYEPGNENATKAEIRDRIIGSLRASMLRVFGDLILSGPGMPMQGGTFLFEKGVSKDFRYANLSAGEKAAFDLLLDFILKVKVFDNTVFCVDEPELHMHTSLQAKLLRELYSLLPNNCQLWIGTHSIGMMREAKRLYFEQPGTVVFLDFHNHNFDEAVELTPIEPDAAFWRKTLRVALDDLADLVAPEHVVFCEGGRPESGARKNAEFDAKCFTRIFAAEYPDVVFVSLGGTEDVERNALLLGAVFKNMFTGVTITTVIDRDDRSSMEVQELRGRRTKVLSVRDLENYLWDDEVLSKLCIVNSQQEKIEEILQAKKDALNASITRGNPSDDYKSMSGSLYREVKRILDLTRGCGNNVQAFCISTLAPLITPDMNVYRQLKTDVFG